MSKRQTQEGGSRIFYNPTCVAWVVMGVTAMILAGCNQQQKSSHQLSENSSKGHSAELNRSTSIEAVQKSPQTETTSPTASSQATARTYDIPRFVINSPFDIDYDSPVPKEGKRLWAKSCLWEQAPDFVVEKWLTGEPDSKGKYILIEFWATWCRQCRLAIPRLNNLHRKFGSDLVVIGVCDEEEEVVRRFQKPKIEYYVAIDTQARMKDKLGVFGIPHVIILEPDGYVVWEGFPLLKGHELTEEVVERILKVGRQTSDRKQK